jgi:hypothetical protein
MKNMAPNSANINKMTRPLPADSATERNSRKGSNGWRASRSRR